MTTEQPRPQTPIDRIAEAHLDAEVELSPLTATYLGLPGHESEIDDLSPDGLAAAIRRLAEDPGLAERLGAAGRERVAALSWADVVARLTAP